MARLLPVIGLLALGACSPEPFGPDNAWFHADARDVPEDLAGTGTEVGDTLADFTFVDQNGDDVQLYQFYGQVVQLVLFAQWCPPCKQEAPEVQQASVDLADSGVQVVEVMLENDAGDPPTVDDLAAWAEEYGATHPIVADTAKVHAPMLLGGFPTNPILDREMVVARPDNFPFDPAHPAEVAGAGD